MALCACGCGGETTVAKKTDHRSGQVKGRPSRFLRGHNRSRRPNPAYLVDEATGCWNWQGHVRPKDQRAGIVDWKGRRVCAYVAFYERAKGPVPVGLVLDHRCRNPRCVNPDHLEAVTYGVNNQRGAGAKLTRESVTEIRVALASGTRRGWLARRFGVAYSTIEEIEKGEAWE